MKKYLENLPEQEANTMMELMNTTPEYKTFAPKKTGLWLNRQQTFRRECLMSCPVL
jgi:hypothetical protein